MPRPDPVTAAVREPTPVVATSVRVCPDCAGQLIHSAGCISCRHCGWGRCG